MANNDAIVNAVLVGATGGNQERWITAKNPAAYAAFNAAVVSIANKVDSLIPAGTITLSQQLLMQSICQGVFSGRYPQASQYQDIAEAVVALYQQVLSSLLPDAVDVEVTTDDVINESTLEPLGGTLTEVLDNLQVERIPTQMVFTEVFRQAWMTPLSSGVPAPAWQTDRLLPPNLQFIDERFTDPSTARFTNLTEATACTLSIAGGQMTLSAPAGVTRMSFVYLTNGGNLGQNQCIVMMDVDAQTGTNGAYKAILMGWIRDSNNFICLNWNIASNVIGLQTKFGGVNNFGPLVSTATWGALPTKIAISVVGNWVSLYALLSGATSWIKVGVGLNINTAPYNVNFKAQDFSLWFPGFGFATPGTFANTLVISDFEAGAFGGVGVRDVCVVTHLDGSPQYENETTVRALATIAGPNGGIAEASQAAFLIDLEKKTFTQTAVIMVNRGGNTQNDHAAMLIQEDGTGDQHLTISTWGDISVNPIRILYKEVAAATDLMEGRNTVSGMVQLNLPVVAHEYWDPFLIFRDGFWYLAYTASPVAANLFYPALARSTDLVTWTDLGSDPAAFRYEGTRILPFNGESYVLTGGQFDMRMYDLDMNYIGIVNCRSPGDGTTQPHAMIFPYNALNLLITFDQTVWPNPGGTAFSWGSQYWFASPRY